MGDVEWYNRVGAVLQVVGYLGAVYLLLRLREDVTGRQDPLLSRLRRARWWFRRTILRRRPATHAISARSHIGVTGTARGYSTQGPMPANLDTAEQIAWLEQWVRHLEERHNALFTEVGQEARKMAETVAEAQHVLTEAIENVRAETRRLIGSHLGLEVLFVLAIGVGTVLTVL